MDRRLRSLRSPVAKTLLVAVIWIAWWLWPPVPELKLLITDPTERATVTVTPNGESLLCSTEPHFNINGDPYRLEVFELPSGRHRLSIRDSEGRWPLICPNGSSFIMWEDQAICLRKLPSGELIRSLPAPNPKLEKIEWTPDGRHLLVFDSRLSANRSDTGELIGQYDARPYLFACRSDGRGFVGLSRSRWELLVGSFDSGETDDVIPLPWPSAYDSSRPDDRPAKGSVSISRLATNSDGSVVFAMAHRYHPDGEKDRSRRFLARWDRATRTWSEADMGPDARWSNLASTLKLDPSGRHLITSEILRVQFKPGGNDDHWGEEEALRFEGRDLWDATSVPPKCRNDAGFPTGLVFFDTTGQRFIHYNCGAEKDVYDSDSLALLSKLTISCWDEPLYSADGRWAAFCDVSESPILEWVGSSAPAWLIRLIGPLRTRSVHVVRLADGKVVRRLNGHWNPYLTSDGSLWTTTASLEDDSQLLVERWNPEPPRVPWWLIGVTMVGAVVVARDWSGRRFLSAGK